MSESTRMKPLFLKAMEDLVRLVFDELDIGLSDYLWSEHKDIHGNFVGFLFMVYHIQCYIAMFD
jgi:hypothetical protein